MRGYCLLYGLRVGNEEVLPIIRFEGRRGGVLPIVRFDGSERGGILPVGRFGSRVGDEEGVLPIVYCL